MHTGLNCYALLLLATHHRGVSALPCAGFSCKIAQLVSVRCPARATFSCSCYKLEKKVFHDLIIGWTPEALPKNETDFRHFSGGQQLEVQGVIEENRYF